MHPPKHVRVRGPPRNEGGLIAAWGRLRLPADLLASTEASKSTSVARRHSTIHTRRVEDTSS
eukprot:3282700-Prymnesium_polylepis.1